MSKRNSSQKLNTNNFVKYLIAIVGILRIVPVQSLLTIGNCFMYNQDQTECIKCDTGYMLDWFGQQCLPLTDGQKNCVQISPFNDCVRCDCGFALQIEAASCISSTPENTGCEVVNNENQCIRPKQDFYLYEEGGQLLLRYQQDTTCEIRDFKGLCKQCHSGYQLDEKARACKKVNFKLDNEFYTIGLQGMFRSRDVRFDSGDKGVYPLIEFCLQYISNNDGYSAKCNKCSKSKVLNESQTKCQISPFFECERVSDSDELKCVMCQNNNYFYLYTDQDNNQMCIPRHIEQYDGCEVRQTETNRCTKCRANFILSEGQCLSNSFQQLQTMTEIEGCITYLSENVCQECYQELKLSTDGSICMQRDAMCEEYDAQGLCSKCHNLMYITLINNNTDTQCVSITDNLLCLVSDGINNTCLKCNTDYYVSAQGQCIMFIQGSCFLSYGVENKCKLCMNLNFLNVLNASTVICVPISNQNRCVVSDGLTDQCKVCANQYVFNNLNQCVPQVQHDGVNCYFNNYYIANPSDKYCTQYSNSNMASCFKLSANTDTCQKCKSGYYLSSNNLCVPLINCNATDGLTNICYQAKYFSSYIDSVNNAILVTTDACNTNRIQNICTNCSVNGVRGLYFGAQCITNDQVSGSVVSHCLHLKLAANGTDYECQLCDNTYYLDSSSGIAICTSTTIQNCVLTDGITNLCLLCDSNYQVNINKVCDIVYPPVPVPFCVQMDLYNICQRCQNLFYITDGGNSCYPISDPQCIQSDGVKNLCIQCPNDITSSIDFFPFSCGIPYCSQYDLVNKICTQCEANYQITTQGKECNSFKTENCAVMQNKYQCAQCIDGYQLITNNRVSYFCKPIRLSNCKIQTLPTKCDQCQSGYVLKENGACVSFNNCKLVPEFHINYCLVCNDDYYLSPDKLFCKKIDNCIVQQGSVCNQCAGGYFVIDNNCYPIPNCIASNGVSISCTQCGIGYSIKDNYCIPLTWIDNCSAQDISGNCIKCNNLYYLNQGNCISITKSNCSLSDGLLNICQICHTFAFVLDSNNNNACLQAEPNCLMTNGKDACLQCYKGYYITQTAITNSKSSCVARTIIPQCQIYSYNQDTCDYCDSKYFLSADYKACLPMAASQLINCLYTNGQTGDCYQCNNDFYYSYGYEYQYKNKSCVRLRDQSFYQQGCVLYSYNNCILCSYNQSVLGHVCNKRLSFDNCLVYQNNLDSCQICNNGYKLVINDNTNNLPYNSICIPFTQAELVTNCAQYQPNTNKCTQCKQYLNSPYLEFYLDQTLNKCKNILQLNCLQYNPVTNTCNQLYLSGCQQTDITDSSKCTLCENMYFLSNNRCLPHQYIANCQEYSQVTQNLCLQCQNLYYLDQTSKICLSISEIHCELSDTSSDKCKVCLPTYSFNQVGVCVYSYIQYCLSIQESSGYQTCTKCYDGFVLSNNQCQVELGNNQNCQSINSNSLKCDKCIDGYFLTNSYDCIPLKSQCTITNCQFINRNSSADNFICELCIYGYTLNDQFKCDKNNEFQDESTSTQTIKQGNSFQETIVIVFIIISAIMVITALVFYMIRVKRKKSYDQIFDRSLVINTTTK